MIELLKHVARFLWRRDSESAACLVIVVSQYLDNRDLRGMAEYLLAVLDYNVKTAASSAKH